MADTATVAVLFCDLVSSTERQTRLGDDAADGFRRRFFSALRSPLLANGGTEIKTLGDGVMAAFESTTAALLCAIAMHEEVAVLDPTDPVLLRIGISVGEVGHEDHDWFGTPVVEAARLCAVAPPGQTLATAVVRTVVGSRGARFRFTDLGPMELKGLPAPVSVVAVDTVDDLALHVPAVAAPPIAPAAASSSRPRRLVAATTLGALAILFVVGWALVADGDDAGGGDPDERVTSTLVTTEVVTRPIGYRPSFRQVECRPDVLAAIPEADCGQLIVPEVRAEPRGRRIHVDVTRAPALTEATSPPVLLVDVNEQLATSPLRQEADVYRVELRGFSPADQPRLVCPDLQETWRATLTLSPDDPRSIDQRRVAAAACAERLRSAGVQLEGYNMAEVADDLRDLVLARRLGRVSIAASGFSTPAAVEFARADPGAIESLLLSNPTPPGESTLANPTLYLSRSFGEIAQRCADDPRCVTRFGDLRAEFGRRVEEYSADPRVVATMPFSPRDEGVPVLLDGRRMGSALAAALKASDQVGLVPSALAPNGVSPELLAAAAINEDLQYYAGADAIGGTVLSFLCSYDARMNRTAEVADAALAQFAGANNPAFQSLCAAWDVPLVFEPLSQPLADDLPVLLVEGGLSVAGVNRWSEQMAATLPNATVLRLPTLSEDVSFVQPPCLREIRREFLARPWAKLSVEACEAASPPIEFVGL